MKLITLFLLLMVFTTVFSQKNKAIFLVHSTGTSLFSEGKVTDWVKTHNSANGTSFQISTRTYPNTPWPWENYPYDYWKLWVDNSCNNSDPDIECLASIASNYGLVIFKHCYPGAGLNSDTGKPDVKSNRKSIENYKLQYRALRTLMDGLPDKKFMVWTLVPLHRLATTTEQAARAYEFVQWVKEQWLTEDGKQHSNIFIFDFFSLAAEMNKNPANGKQYCLKYDYEYSHTSNDSHPNTLANATIGPLFAQAAIKVLTTNYHITNISIKAPNGAASIDTDNGTLQLHTEIIPVDALNKTVTWSVYNETGKASISVSGLLTAENNGTVKVIAAAKDGSGIKGELQITISNQIIPVESVTVNSPSGNAITADKGTLQLQAVVLPDDASTKTVTWSVINETGKAAISSSGLLTAENNGTVKVIAIAKDGSGIKAEVRIDILNQTILIQNITIMDTLKKDTIYGTGINLPLIASLTPDNATNQKVNWFVENLTGMATISSDGVLTTQSFGTVKVIAKAMDGSNIISEKEYQIDIPVLNHSYKKNIDFQVHCYSEDKRIQVQLNFDPTEVVILEVRNLLGQKLLEQKIHSSTTNFFPNSSGHIFLIILRFKNQVRTKMILL